MACHMFHNQSIVSKACRKCLKNTAKQNEWASASRGLACCGATVGMLELRPSLQAPAQNNPSLSANSEPMASVPTKWGKEDPYKTGCACHPMKVIVDVASLHPYFSPRTINLNARHPVHHGPAPTMVLSFYWMVSSSHRCKWSRDRNHGLAAGLLQDPSLDTRQHVQSLAPASGSANYKASSHQSGKTE